MLMIGWDFGVDALSRSCDIYSTLGSVVPLAMITFTFICLHVYIFTTMCLDLKQTSLWEQQDTIYKRALQLSHNQQGRYNLCHLSSNITESFQLKMMWWKCWAYNSIWYCYVWLPCKSHRSKQAWIDIVNKNMRSHIF